jgi:hypothetical protein
MAACWGKSLRSKKSSIRHWGWNLPRYKYRECRLTNEKEVYKLDTRSDKGAKFPLPREVIEDSVFWSILLDATEKTQRPFLERVIKSYRYYKDRCFSFEDLLRVIHENPSRFNRVRSEISILLQMIYSGEVRDYDQLFDDIEYFNHNNQSVLRNKASGKFFDLVDELKKYLCNKIKETETVNIFNSVDCKKIDALCLFEIVLQYRFIYETLKEFSNDEHISPMMKRSEKRINEISKVFEFKNNAKNKKNIQVVSISNCNIHMKKIVPLLICKEIYEQH